MTTMSDDRERPLSEVEIVELDEALARLPEDSDPLDVGMLDGFLVGVLLQPEPIAAATWLPYVFAADGGALPQQDNSARMIDLVMRRYDELAACIAAREPFDPIVFELEDDAGAALEGKPGIAALAPWAIGLATALDAFPSLREAYERDDELAAAIVGILRHLPPPPEADAGETQAHAAQQARMEQEAPLADLDDAIDDLVTCVLEAADIARPNRPVTRTTPKVGRNEPCPCGSGRKYKACHGREPPPR